MTTRDMLSLAEVADRTGWPVESLRRACRTGQVEHHRFGRGYYLSVAQYEALLESTRQRTAPRPLTEAERKAAAIASTRAANVARMRRGAA